MKLFNSHNTSPTQPVLGEENPPKRFYPDYLFLILQTAFWVILAVSLLALFFPVKMGHLIDFSVPYTPLPEWYFLWVYELMKYFPGHTMVIGTMLLPVIGLLLLFFLPLFDTKEKPHRKRAFILFFTLAFLFWALTALSLYVTYIVWEA